MPLWRIIATIASALSLMCAATAGSFAADFPNRTVRIIVPYPPGGSADTQARILADALRQQWGQPVIIENKPGAGTMIGAVDAASAKPDGYTLYMAPGAFTIVPHLHKSPPYDPAKSFDPVSLVSTSFFLLLVSPKSGINSLGQLVALAKSKPGKVTFASQGIGGTPHLLGELFKARAGIDVIHVPFTGAPASFNAVVSGNVDYVIGDVTAVPLVKGGLLKALAVTSPERSAILPDVPTFAEGGVNGVENTNWGAIVAPAGTPPDILDFLNRSIVQALGNAEVKQRFERLGFAAASSSRAQLATRIKSDFEKFGEIIRKAGIQPN
ncbi:MAG: tripartite tricarboxylate transporter substrate binding protein [Xanthobacteraceae bacterium]